MSEGLLTLISVVKGPLFSRSRLPLQQKTVDGSRNRANDVPDPGR